MSDKNHLTEREIDEIVAAQANNDDVWEEPINVKSAVLATVALPPRLAVRAAFFAQLHNMVTAEEWLQRIIQERVDFEEATFAGLKRVMEKRPDYNA